MCMKGDVEEYRKIMTDNTFSTKEMIGALYIRMEKLEDRFNNQAPICHNKFVSKQLFFWVTGGVAAAIMWVMDFIHG